MGLQPGFRLPPKYPEIERRNWSSAVESFGLRVWGRPVGPNPPRYPLKRALGALVPFIVGTWRVRVVRVCLARGLPILSVFQKIRRA